MPAVNDLVVVKTLS